jgi:acyl-CoA-binding protein
MHDSWKRLKGMAKEEAMGKYIAYIKELLVEEKLTVASFSK